MDFGLKYVARQLLFILLVVILCLIFLAIGLMLGYSIFGQGDNPFAILSPSKWSDIFAKFTG
ncbi:DNA-directed RNA polymerase subunit beta [Streptococcus sp.]|nr:DNA-directed RNA polymerase subunit beta [Streptococcus sp.]MDY3823755.1 DNA-directed RNA polymerase subunit beta [Streptococcus sp.]